ncbi:uncharacterized protein [Procambarus clarkii]|uniref:uncharacterized protein isoform X1 n=1 Tax=Procambarus clarkii TaxID=6728 RepID=UPI003742E95B
MKVLQEEMARTTHSGDSSDAETKVLVVAKRETECLCEELRACLGSISVALLTGLQGYHQVLRVLESHSVVVWSEAEGGEALHQLPCSQFSLVVEWEGAGVPASACVQHCTRQNIPVISLTHLPGGRVEEEGSREEKRARIIPSVEEPPPPQREAGGGGASPDTFTLVASSTVTNNAELHYILTSIYNINLVERCLRDVVLEEEGGGAAHAWPHLLLDERTSVLLQPLHQLRTDAHLHQLTCQVVLLSLQCTTCYIILYSHPPANSGYVFRSGVVKALARLVATCALFRSPDYTVSLLLAHNLHQVGEMVRKVGEATLAASPCWDREEWTTRPWLTPQMSSHERFLLSLPCINSITAQVILTAMSLSEVLTLPLPALLSALPWIPEKVTTMLYKLLHRDDGAAVMDITSHDVDGRGGRSVMSSPPCVGESVSVEPSVVEASQHPHPPGHPHSWQGDDDEDNGERTRGGYSGMLSVVDGRDHYAPDHIYEGDREGSSVGFPVYTEHGNNTLLPVYNTKSEYSDRLYSDCGSRAANDPHSLNTAVVPSEDRLSGDLFNARDYLTSVTSAAGTSLEYPQKMSLLQPISVVQPIPPTQHRPLLLSESEQYQPVLQLQQLMPCQSTTLQQQQTTLPLPSPSHLCQQVSQTDQSAPMLQQSISQPCQPILQPQQPVPQLQHSTSQMHVDQHVHNYYQQNEEPLVVSPYFPDSQNYYCHQAGDQNKVAETHSQQQLHPNVASASKRVQTQYSDICLLSENGNQMVPLHSGETQYNNIPAYRTRCGNIQQLQLQQQHEQQLLQKLQQQQQQQQQEHPQTQQQQENQQMQQQHKYWKESSLHHHPLTPRLHGNKVLGVAKPYQWHGSGSMPVPPSPKVTLRQEGRGHDIPEEYNLAMSQVRGAGSSQVLSTQEVKKLIYRKVPGRGGQTQLAFKPI